MLSIREDGSAGGATGFAIELIRGLADEPGNIVFALCADWNIDLLKEILPKKIRFLQIAGADKQLKTGLANRILSKLRYKIKANGILHANKIDVLCCPFSAVGNREEGIPVVSTILDIQHEFYPQLDVYKRQGIFIINSYPLIGGHDTVNVYIIIVVAVFN